MNIPDRIFFDDKRFLHVSIMNHNFCVCGSPRMITTKFVLDLIENIKTFEKTWEKINYFEVALQNYCQ